MMFFAIIPWDTWKAGWYTAEVQSYDMEEDIISVIYVKEPESIYTEVTPLVLNKKISVIKKTFP